MVEKVEDIIVMIDVSISMLVVWLHKLFCGGWRLAELAAGLSVVSKNYLLKNTY
jgi:hypothetical protein